ncbi:unnamed protein product [Vicia faba]|uniref:EF-hand domain-containing protein n=1 Tax=Vicia faba TaxID=3906 RepID=A0AAV1AGL3_VICFA|nr:unnamed protein product [Vicia faba]
MPLMLLLNDLPLSCLLKCDALRCFVLPNDEEILKAFGGFGKLALQVMYILVWLVMFMLVCELNGTGFWLWPLTGLMLFVFKAWPCLLQAELSYSINLRIPKSFFSHISCRKKLNEGGIFFGLREMFQTMDNDRYGVMNFNELKGVLRRYDGNIFQKIKPSNTLKLNDCLGFETPLKLLKNYSRSYEGHGF